MKPFLDWQTQAFNQLNEKLRNGGKDFLTVVSVGGGKTYFASRSAKHLIDRNIIDRVVVITPTINLVENWAATTTECGLRLRRGFGNSIFDQELPPDSDGYVTTFASLGAAPYVHEKRCTERRTLTILDEIHHLCEVASQGKAAALAFGNVIFRHHLSGTPLRSDKKFVPFLEYAPRIDGGWTLKPDFTYSYGQAVADKVCRQVAFIPFGEDAEIEFSLRKKEYNLSFEDDVNKELQRERLWNSLFIKPNNVLLRKMLKKGDSILGDVRRDHGNAGGLIIANDQWSAGELAKMLYDNTGKKAVVVTSDEPKAHETLERFKDSNDPWIISVKMVSEGVDIRRLRVMLYLAMVTEELFFIQCMGRIVRMMSEYPGLSYFLMPRDNRFLAIAQKVQEEVNTCIEEKMKRGGGGGGCGDVDRDWQSANGEEASTVLGGHTFAPEVLPEVVEAKRRFSSISHIPEVELAGLRNFFKGFTAPDKDESSQPEESWDKRREDKSKMADKLVSAYCYRVNRNGEQQEVHNEFNSEVGIRSQKNATLEQLETKIRLIKERIAKL